MSTLTVTNIKATGETASRAVSGVAAAWVNYDQSTPQIDDSLNVASVTDNASGDFTPTFSSAFANAEYSRSGFVESGGAFVTIFQYSASAATTTTIRVLTQNSATTSLDRTNSCVTIHGDLA